MQEEKQLSQVSEDMLQKPFFIEIDRKPDTLLKKLLIKFKIIPAKYKFKLRPILVGNVYRISSKAVLIPKELLQDIVEGSLTKALMEGAFHHIKDLAYIVAVGIQNNSDEPSEELLKLIENDFTVQELAFMVDKVLVKMDISNFLNSIVLVKGKNILKVMQDEDNLNTVNQMKMNETSLELGEMIAPID